MTRDTGRGPVAVDANLRRGHHTDSDPEARRCFEWSRVLDQYVRRQMISPVKAISWKPMAEEVDFVRWWVIAR